ncbi:MAG: hypothetical protein Q8M76_12580 [Spirochaetaceae bacterium]|nr:hypothetical protein [Spirochaetaceae bacterium]
MDEWYGEELEREYAPRERDDEIGGAAAVFKKMLEEMGIDPLDRSEWLERFTKAQRARVAANAG